MVVLSPVSPHGIKGGKCSMEGESSTTPPDEKGGQNELG